MNQPRPESRISVLEKRASTLEAQIEELSSDTAEGLRDLKQDIKQLNDGMVASFLQIKAFGSHTSSTEWGSECLEGDTFNLLDSNIEAVKQDLGALKAAQEARFDKLEATQVAQNERFDKLEAIQAEILALLKQNRPDK